jgi:hypothetical protein
MVSVDRASCSSRAIRSLISAVHDVFVHQEMRRCVMSRLMRCVGIGTLAVGLAVPAGAVGAEVLEDDGTVDTAVVSCSANQRVVLETFSPMARRRALAMIGFDDAPTGPVADMRLEVVRHAIRSSCE